MILHLSPTCLPVRSGPLSRMSVPRLMFPLPTLDTVGRMFLHLSPLVSLLVSVLVALVSHLSRRTLDTHGWMFLHLSPLVPLVVSLLVCSRPDDSTLASLPVSLLVSLVSTVSAYSGYAWPDYFTLIVSHVSPRWSFCFCLPSCYSPPACLTSQIC